MGRIKTARIKRVTNEILEKYPDKFKENFEENKKILDELIEVESKRIRNIIAGYLTRKVKSKKKAS